MKISFSKYQGTGNDFIMLDNREDKYSRLTRQQVEFVCNRRFGIGADGLILLEKKEDADFYMKYYNSDGNESSMCGNGGRCIAAFARSLNLVDGEARFTAIDGLHQALIASGKDPIVKLKMGDVAKPEIIGSDIFLNTGSPHYVKFVDDVREINVVEEGRIIRYNEKFKKEGTNVNFAQRIASGLAVRSYERGVEDETLSCGTGVTASVLAAVAKGIIPEDANFCEVKSEGGMLKVHFEKSADGFKNVWLEGQAAFVYSGEIEI